MATGGKAALLEAGRLAGNIDIMTFLLGSAADRGRRRACGGVSAAA
jgi:hypothetical protein